jgi:hypothetical protein
MLLDFFKELISYVSKFEWWQGLIILFVMMFTLIVGKFWRNILDKILGETSETLHYRMFWGLSNDAVNIKMKDEIRRSFKENGFCELEEKDFLQYVSNQSKNLISALKNHFINLYPPDNRGMLVTMEEILDHMDREESKYSSVILEIYMEAKKFKKQDDEIMEEIDKKFEQEITDFAKNKSTVDCGSCITIMFGKKLITENKKAKFKTLKSQMNFAEQKLTELHSSLIAFYSEKINENKKKIK